MQDFRFNEDFRVRTIPVFPPDAYARADAFHQRKLTKTHAYRSKRAKQTPDVQRQQKWDAPVRRARKAAAAGRVQIWSWFTLVMRFFFFFWFSTILTWVVGISNYWRGMDKDMPHNKPPKNILVRMNTPWRWPLRLMVLTSAASAIDSNAWAQLGWGVGGYDDPPPHVHGPPELT